MSNIWYTFDWYFKKDAKAQSVYDALVSLQKGDVKASAEALEALGADEPFSDLGWDDPLPATVSNSKKRVRAHFQLRTSSDVPEHLIEQVAGLGARLTKLYVFNDQVGEATSLYYKKGEEVDLEDVLDDFAEVDPSFKLAIAFEDDEPEQALKLLRRGADPNAEVEDDPLIFAAIDHGWSKVAIAAIEAGANLEVRDDELHRPLHMAADEEELGVDVVRSMVAHGADVHARNEYKQTPLNVVAGLDAHDALARAIVLIEAGADINAVSDYGSVLWVARAHNAALARHLVGLGAQAVPASDSYGDDPESDLTTAIMHDDREKFDALFDEATCGDIDKSKLVECCVQYDRPEFLQRIAPGEVSAFTKVGDKTALGIAAWYGSLSIASQLVEELGEATGNAQREVLVDALVAFAGGADTVTSMTKLIACSTDLDAKSTTSASTAVEVALLHGHMDNVRLLLEAGANPNYGDEYERTYMFQAAKLGPEWVKLLLHSGAEADVSDEDGKTPLHVAARTEGAAESIAALVAAGADVNAHDQSEATPLHEATKDDRTAANAGALIDAGADRGASDEDEKTPADYARSYRARAVLALLE